MWLLPTVHLTLIGIFVALTPPEPPEFIAMRAKADDCWDCPFLLFERPLVSYFAPIPYKVFAIANFPAVRLAAWATDNKQRFGLQSFLFMLVSTLQWVLVGATWHWWRYRRSV